MSKTKLVYKDVAPGAAEDAAVTTNGAQTFAVPVDLAAGAEGITVATCELNQWGLDGNFPLVDGQSAAYWSTALSGADGAFAAELRPQITVAFDQQYSSVGVTLTFDTATGGYCPSVNIKWYQGTTLKEDKTFAPAGIECFCRQKVASYDKVVITLNSTNLPYRYARLEKIIFGVIRTYSMAELRNAHLTNEINALAVELPTSTLRWTLDGREAVDYMFQLKQPVEVWNDTRLVGVYYIDASRRNAGNLYELDCYDAIGVLGESSFAGGVYSAKSATALLGEIVGTDFAVTVETTDAALTGAILPCSRREAIQQVLFAWGACASTDGQSGIRIFALPTTATEIGAERTYEGAVVDTAAVVTEVRVTSHTFTQDAAGEVEIGGVKYADAQAVYTVINPDVTANDKQNIVEISGGTLVSAAIGQATAQRVYDHYLLRNTHKAKIVWDGEQLGDRVTLPNAWSGTNTGNIVKMEIILSNTVAASCETLGV